MGKMFTEIDDDLRAFIAAQQMFFVATAPLSADGHVNLSPKGLDSFRVLGPTSVAYLDLTGSGVETIAHLRENGRLTVLFCAFDGRPRIVRLQGRGRVVLPTGLSFSPAGFVGAAILRSDPADLDTVLDAPPRMRPYIESTLARMSPTGADDYYSLCGRLDTLEHVHEVLVAVAAGSGTAHPSRQRGQEGL